MKYWIFSILTCALSYLIGSLSTNLIASRLIFHKNLRKLGKGERWLPNFYRLYGVKGFLKLALVEFVKDAIPVLIGGLLFSGGENDEVGRALAAFCVVLGRLYPSMFGFRGSFASGAIVVCTMFINFSAGLIVLAVLVLTAWLTRYLSLATLAGAVALAVASVLTVDNVVALRLCIFTAVLILIRVFPSFSRISAKTEPRLTLREDISYKFDEKF